MMQKIGVVMVNYHGDQDTQACLDSLSRINHHETIEVLVVQPDTKEAVIACPGIDLKIINKDENLGYSFAVNLGIKQAINDGCELLIVLNNDTIVDKNILGPIIDRLNDKKVGLLSPKIYFEAGKEFHHNDYKESERGKVIWYAGGVVDWDNIYAWHFGVNEVDHGQFDKSCETDFATGCCVAFRSDLINKIGLWDERYFLYMEDVDWSIRAKQAGLKVIFEPRAIIWHKNAGSTGGPGSKMHRYYQTRNRLLFASKYASFRTKAAIYRQALKSLSQADDTEKQAIRDGLRKRWGKSSI